MVREDGKSFEMAYAIFWKTDGFSRCLQDNRLSGDPFEWIFKEKWFLFLPKNHTIDLFRSNRCIFPFFPLSKTASADWRHSFYGSFLHRWLHFYQSKVHTQKWLTWTTVSSLLSNTIDRRTVLDGKLARASMRNDKKVQMWKGKEIQSECILHRRAYASRRRKSQVSGMGKQGVSSPYKLLGWAATICNAYIIWRRAIITGEKIYTE